ncbi:helix-turn-helix transcriptional regulator [Tengunoibacter tsumagoiensis]|uniref:Transcriptional regulator n=1 Tax=Tengunoibacter tsumagoiensis TaxID=2014871 RepID=A0A402A7A0_9CHLR|nr:helix-turn-helix transcriptional regulator [Tengunoibacter tsumagoiensis]GCE15012.1 transcriptional regulator [Tengunoibacter tsumagoiensis]
MTERVKRRAGLSDFLRTRRARLRPEQFDFPTGARRHTPGLRREELAGLVGVGISWYTWLEQGRDIQVSDHVLSRLADILQLDVEERRHLFTLARDRIPLPGEADREKLSPHTPYQAILDAFLYPAQLLDHRLNVVAGNSSASQLFGDYSTLSERERNLAWSLFMNPLQRQRFVHWERAARGCIAHLRAIRDQYGDEAWVTELIADLQAASPEFRAWWPAHEILLTCNSFGELYHPLVGNLALQITTLTVPERPDWGMVVYTPLSQTDTATKLDALMRGEAYPHL